MHVQTADGVQVIDTSPPCSGCESPPHCQLQIGCTVTLTHDLHTQQKATIFTTRLSAKRHRLWLAASALLTSTPSSCREQLSFGTWLSFLLAPRASCKRSTHAYVKNCLCSHPAARLSPRTRERGPRIRTAGPAEDLVAWADLVTQVQSSRASSLCAPSRPYQHGLYTQRELAGLRCPDSQ